MFTHHGEEAAVIDAHHDERHKCNSATFAKQVDQDLKHRLIDLTLKDPIEVLDGEEKTMNSVVSNASAANLI